VYALDFQIFLCGFCLFFSLCMLGRKYHLQRCFKYSAEDGVQNFKFRTFFFINVRMIKRYIDTECHVLVVNTPASYSEDPRFRSLPGD
jgi:hypothetical protein